MYLYTIASNFWKSEWVLKHACKAFSKKGRCLAPAAECVGNRATGVLCWLPALSTGLITKLTIHQRAESIIQMTGERHILGPPEFAFMLSTPWILKDKQTPLSKDLRVKFTRIFIKTKRIVQPTSEQVMSVDG